MTKLIDETTDILKLLKELFEDKIPFNHLLGMKFESIAPGDVCLKIQMRDDLVGNFAKGVLHGGVIASVLDVTGGVIAMVDVIEKMKGRPVDEFFKKLMHVGTIDLRVDYLRPGKGESFMATGVTLRTGRKVSVIRMQLHNERGLLIAAGTGTYIIGS